MEYNDILKAEKYAKEWQAKTKKLFYDIEIINTRYLTLDECDTLDWVDTGIVIYLSNGLMLVPANKDASDAGSLLLYKEGNFIDRIPAIKRRIDLKEYYKRG